MAATELAAVKRAKNPTKTFRTGKNTGNEGLTIREENYSNVRGIKGVYPQALLYLYCVAYVTLPIPSYLAGGIGQLCN